MQKNNLSKQPIHSYKQRNIFILISVIAVGLFAYLAYLFPYMCDDWAWGSVEGMERLQSFFANYNGRYFGNLLVILISKSKFLDIVLMTLSYYGICLLCYKYTPKKSNATLLFAIVLFFAMPKDYFTQAVAWTSGYANYVPSALISGAYIYLMRNITGIKIPEYHRFLFVGTFIMGFSGALFMENVTLFNICLGFAVIFWSKVKFKKFYLPQVAFFIGSVIGALWMFSNGSYFAIVNGKDGYRSTPSDLASIIETAKSHLVSIVDFVIFSNWLMCIAATILLGALVYKYFKRTQTNERHNAGIVLCLTTNIISLIFIILENMYTYNTTLEYSFGFMQGKKFQVIVAFLYIISIALLVLMCVEKGRRFRMLLPFYCVPVVIAPLLLVNPVTARCFFAAYVFMMLFLVDLFGYIMREYKFSGFNFKAVTYFLSIILTIQAFIYISIFYPVHVCDIKRNDFAKLQAENGAKTVYTCHLPNLAYLWISSPSGQLYATRYKSFHGLDDDIVFEFVSIEELDKLIENYKIDKD